MKKIINLLFIVLSVALWVSCSPQEEDLFGDSSANRIDAALKADKEILTGATNGWLMEYYPSKTQQYGGYNILLSFSADGMVTVSSDMFGPDEKATSTYSLYQSAGRVLVFDTYNEIMHFFSEPKNSAGIGTNGKGMEGDLEFIIIESSKDKIVLQGRKTRNVIVMTPLKADVKWVDYLTTVNKANKVYSSFRYYDYAEGAFTASVAVSYRNLSITYAEGDGSVTVGAPYLITEEGNLKLYKPLVLNGKTINGLTFQANSGGGVVVPTNDVKGVFTPVTPLNSQLADGDWYFALSGLSPSLAANWKLIKTTVMPTIGKPLEYVLFTPSGPGSTAFYWDCGGVGYLLFNNVLVGKNQIKFDFASSGNSYGVSFWNKYQWSYMVAPFNTKTFILTADNQKNPTVMTMTDKANAKNTIKLYKNEILDPLNH